MTKILYCVPDWRRLGQRRVVAEHISALGCDFFTPLGDRPTWVKTGHGEALKRKAARLQHWDTVVITSPDSVRDGFSFPADKYVYLAQDFWPTRYETDNPRAKFIIEQLYVAVGSGAKFIATSEWVREELHGLGFVDVELLSNGANPQDFYTLDDIGPTHNQYILLSGDPQTDPAHVALKVARELHRKYDIPSIGMGNSYLAASHLEDSLYIFRPRVRDYRRLYSGAKFLLKCSAYSSCSLAPLEAAACGTPTVRGIANGDDYAFGDFPCLRTGYRYADVLDACETMLHDRIIKGRLIHAARVGEYGWGPAIARLKEVL